ncbi:conserved exported hypothetical protein [Paraburkholderia tropica]|uniref:DUF4148 domain-containing protein n=1 Tax=Paraburkholderia tropica TaxID=92647 RepID=UPI001CAF2823|nr:DUF4148 domain-containing protein [Paraburkholderia tropica]CAG9204174.1 conserved exported hypothetical protein [Paraburkholderia tropica]
MSIRRAMFATFIALASVGAAAQASAQGLTREEVRQQLIEAEANGSRFVTDTSYPDVSPVFAHQVAAQQPTQQRAQQRVAQTQADPAAQSGMGMPMHGTSESGAPQVCVGPASFCNIYAGG